MSESEWRESQDAGSQCPSTAATTIWRVLMGWWARSWKELRTSASESPNAPNEGEFVRTKSRQLRFIYAPLAKQATEDEQ